jgi:hypothetical protein
MSRLSRTHGRVGEQPYRNLSHSVQAGWAKAMPYQSFPVVVHDDDRFRGRQISSVPCAAPGKGGAAA